MAAARQARPCSDGVDRATPAGDACVHMRAPSAPWVLTGLATAIVACTAAAPPACPPCQCVCTSASAAPAAVPAAAPTAARAAAPPPAGVDVSELVASANRKMFHDDGAGCLADLALVRQADPRAADRLVAIDAQCEMLVGRCQEGKRRLTAYYRDETNLSEERAAAIAEQMGAMRCRGGDSTPRDELLRALYELSDAAYVNKRDPGYCRERVAAVRRLAPAVGAGPEDAQIAGGTKALFHTAAACFAKAGDCAGALAAYRDNYPVDALAAIKSPVQRETIVKDGFRSSVPACQGAP